jgi:hypothetical protein
MQQFWDKLVNLTMFYLLNNDYFAQMLGVDLFGPPMSKDSPTNLSYDVTPYIRFLGSTMNLNH